jgi:hypothetical protein
MNDRIEDLVKDEFDLRKVPLEITTGIHWEIGHGWIENYQS